MWKSEKGTVINGSSAGMSCTPEVAGLCNHYHLNLNFLYLGVTFKFSTTSSTVSFGHGPPRCVHGAGM